MSNQYEWADALRKAQNNAQIKKPTLDISTQPKISLEQLEEQLAYYKNKLIEAANTKNTAEIQNLLDRIINTHARMTALLIRQEKELGATDNAPSVQGHLEKYFSDCNTLLELFPS